MLDSITLRRSSPTPLRSQLTSQLEGLILEGAYQAGRRLPSLRAAAGRLSVHRNTVAAAYRELQRRGLVSTMRGSGVFVRAEGTGPAGAEPCGPPTYAAFIRKRAAEGDPHSAIVSGLRSWAEAIRSRRLLLMCEDSALAAVLCQELRDRLGPVSLVVQAEPGGRQGSSLAWGRVPLAVRAAGGRLPGSLSNPDVLDLRICVPRCLRERLARLPVPSVLGIVSASVHVRRMMRQATRTARGDGLGIVAAGPDEGPSLRRVERHARVVVVDVLCQRELRMPPHIPVIGMRLISEPSLRDLHALFGSSSASPGTGQGLRVEVDEEARILLRQDP